MDPDFDARRSDMLSTIVAYGCLAVGVGCIGLAAYVAWREVRQGWRWKGVGR